MATIELRDVTKDWGAAVAVDAMNLSIADGEFIAILGPSGCGKSTTLFMLAGIYMPTGGDIFFDGQRVNDVEARDRNVGIVFQSYALYPNMTVLQNILFPLRFKKMGKEQALQEARSVADLVQIGALLDRRPSQLSGGQQQRVALARALIKKPNLLLLDEPLSNLDATLRLSMRAEIRRIQRELGVTTVLVTHDQIEAMTMADRIVCMNAGRIEQAGPPDSLYARPDSAFVASFIGSPPVNLLDAAWTGERLAVGETTLALADGSAPVPAELRFGIRPEHLVAGDQPGLPAKITACEAMGRETLYQAKTPLGDLHFLEPTAVPRFRPGDALNLGFEPQKALLFDRKSGRRIDGVEIHV